MSRKPQVPPTDDTEVDVKKTSQPDSIVATLQGARKNLEEVQDEASELLKKKPKTKEEVEDLAKKTDAVERKGITSKKHGAGVGTVASAFLILGAAIAAGPVGAAVAYGVVKGVTKLWDWAAKKKEPETPKPTNQKSDTVTMDVKSTPTPKPGALKPAVRGEVQQWRVKGYSGQKTEATMNVAGMREAKLTQLRSTPAFSAISTGIMFKPAEPTAGKLPAMGVPITPSPKQGHSLTPQRQEELKSEINLAVASGAARIDIPKNSGFTVGEQKCMRDHIQALNDAAKKAGTSAAAVAQSNPTDSTKMDIAIKQAPAIFTTAKVGQDQTAVATQNQQQQQNDQMLQQQQAAFQLQSQNSQLSEIDKLTQVEFDTDDIGFNAEDDLTSQADNSMNFSNN